MIKLMFALRRRPEMTREEFQRYWREHHAPLVRDHAAALAIRRYVQVHAVSNETSRLLATGRGSEPDQFDGLAELWFDSLEAMRAAAATPQGRAAGRALLEDERRFIDLPRSPVWLGEEHPIVASP